MDIHSGTEEATQLFNDLRKAGYLVDAYSHEFLKSQDNDWEGGTQLEFVQAKDKALGTDCINHMLIIHLSDNCEIDTASKLAKIYPKMNWIADNTVHQPDFLFFNLATQKILCAGLGRKNRIFVYDAVDHKDMGGNSSVMNDVDKENFKEFAKLDYAGFVDEFLETLEKLGDSNYFLFHEWDGDEDSSDFLDAEDGITEAMNFINKFFPKADANELDPEMG